MAHSTIKGATVPDAGDDLLAAWDAYDRTVGTIMPADSIAAARTKLASAEAAGVGPTAAHPWYFDMGGTIYRATGEKSKEGVFKLAPVNVAQFFSGGIFRPSLIFSTITTSTHRPTRYPNHNMVIGPSAGRV